nr:type II secretion system F family protein [bacterium]
MKNKLGASYLGYFFMELGLLIDAGIPAGEGVGILAQGGGDSGLAGMLEAMHRQLEEGQPLSGAMRQAGRFPEYAVSMVALGEETGNLDVVLKGLSQHYEQQEQIAKAVKNAVMYPAVLLVMMAVVVVLILTRVLPIFNDVFSQMGATMSPMATVLLNLGNFLRGHGVAILSILAGVAALLIALGFVPRVRRAVSDAFASTRLGQRIARSRFASTLSMTLYAGLDSDRALDMAAGLTRGSAIHKKIALCKSEMAGGASLAQAIEKAGIFSPVYARMLSIGFKAGSGDAVMADIARRSTQEMEEGIDRALSRIEPAMVIVLAVVVGLILLSVMLPLMGIMSSMM